MLSELTPRRYHCSTVSVEQNFVCPAINVVIINKDTAETALST